MNTRERIALAWPPMLLRLALGVTFLWVGAEQVFNRVAPDPADAAALASLGIAAPAGSTALPAARQTATTPADPPPPSQPLPPSKPSSTKGSGSKATPDPKKPATPNTPPRKDAKPPKAQPAGLALDPEPTTPGPDGLPRLPIDQIIDPTNPPVVAAATAKDAPEPSGQLRALYRTALVIQAAGGTPQPTRSRLWPASLSSGRTPLYVAWAAALVALLGGAMTLAGLLTRACALGFVALLASTIWLMDIGPATQSGTALWGFLPTYPLFDLAAWQGTLWRFGLLCAAGALLFAGPGLAAMDNVLFRSGGGGGGGGGGSGGGGGGGKGG
jgi:uncharacterized membrane protein YphA (DoxX/SURF4 family)